MKTVLVVDDSMSIRQMVAFTLKSTNYQVVEAANGKEGVDKFKTGRFDLVISDVNMPVMDGLSMIKEIRKLTNGKTIPIMVLTTESSDTMKTQGRAAGASGWIVKPFDPNKLIEVVRKLIGNA